MGNHSCLFAIESGLVCLLGTCLSSQDLSMTSVLPSHPSCLLTTTVTMLITDKSELLLLLVIFRREIDFFLESANAGPTEAERACSEFFRAISYFLEQAAETDFKQFKDGAWMIVVDQSQISDLVSDLRMDVQLFIASLESAPTEIDGLARTEFLECVFEFLGGSIRIIEEPKDDHPSPATPPASLKMPALGAYLPRQNLNPSANHIDIVCNCADGKPRSPNVSNRCSGLIPQSDCLLMRKRKNRLPQIHSKPP